VVNVVFGLMVFALRYTSRPDVQRSLESFLTGIVIMFTALPATIVTATRKKNIGRGSTWLRSMAARVAQTISGRCAVDDSRKISWSLVIVRRHRFARDRNSPRAPVGLRRQMNRRAMLELQLWRYDESPDALFTASRACRTHRRRRDSDVVRLHRDTVARGGEIRSESVGESLTRRGRLCALTAWE